MSTVGTGRPEEQQYPIDNQTGLFDPNEQQLALVPYRELAELLRCPKMTAWHRFGLIAPWGVALLFWVFALKSSSDQRAIQTANLTQTQSLVSLAGAIDNQNKQVESVVNSLASLKSAVVSSSARADEIQARMERSRQELKRLESRVETAQTQLTMRSTSAAEAGARPPIKPVHSYKIASRLVPSIKGAQVESDSNGQVVYWLIPRETSGNIHMIKVLPIAVHPSGVLVHDVNKGVDYVVTNSGNWIREPS